MSRIALALTIAFPLAFAVAANAAIDFTLDDQYEKTHTQADIFAGKAVVMMAGMERKTPDAMEAWNKALRRKAPPTVLVVGLSNLEGVPKGSTISVAVFDAHGERLGVVNGPVTDERMAQVLALLPP